jgi:Delta7-sterol 5-desaturase
MDYALDFCDEHFFTPYVYPESWPADWYVRQFASLFVMTVAGGCLLYLSAATFSYYFLFDHELLKHPKILRDKNGVPNQVQQEIWVAVSGTPGMALPTALLFLAEVNGGSKLYDRVDERGVGFLLLSLVSFILFTDCTIYWIHRGLHHPAIYTKLHKLHHKWKVPTPFASHAFHPIDGFLQSLPYHIYPFLFPLHKTLYLGLFVLINLWSTSIHDGLYCVPKALQPYVNGSAHHSDHHLFFNFNYGEYLTLWDRLGGSFKDPSAYHECGVHDDLAKMKRGVVVKDDDYDGSGPTAERKQQ